ncbi:MAG: glycerol-3-phosphate 1-O-acyltransferase PlsY [Eubacteriales bacterium]|jgi:glycerol-3-phosphate acyltransferase PlsY|nr:glycerol-3-phosphate 1-O-acyltransferase PlsY [Bacillota bacterium]MBV1727810.1 glycerol-3-phosphate 1-O-acyltransferase PlsY [Desulforudis sp.]MDP3050057.1 glycerol-3-phosphate 1-O-acyltransferase PlsY [Eubacteriales bacterium]MDQ7788446.1 glycerol-3-phosphate 1-O-acyltransferase PlsY [Clostridia bacterium]MBU4532419.1 glycerol-3-phosphate 1-O-acyltransferase PlsY [Bacillota bacterium]
MELVLLVLVSYLIGSIPTGFLIGKLVKGVDVRTQGSGNIGATNVWRSLGPAPALAALAGDVTKGIGAVLLGRYFGPPGFELITAGAALAGHGWSVFLRFQGGKMVATMLGILLLLPPVALVAAVATWFSTVILTRYVSLASMLAAVAIPVAWAVAGAGTNLVVFGTAVTVVVFFKHRSNIIRLVSGTENRFSLRK